MLAIDPDTRERLARLDGRVVRVRVADPAATPRTGGGAGERAAGGTVTDTDRAASDGRVSDGRRPLELALALVDGRVDVLRVFDGEADVTITGTLGALRSLADTNDALYTGAVRIEGDIGVAQGLRDVVGGLEIDVEEIVAPFLGGTLARRAGLLARDLGGWLGRTRSRVREDAKDYLEEEIALVPTADEVGAWGEEVDELRGAADRLAARVARLERRRDAAGATGTPNASDASPAPLPGAGNPPDEPDDATT